MQDNGKSINHTGGTGISKPVPCVAVTPSSQKAREALSRARKIAILTKFRFMGDTVVATPFIGQLREHFPDKQIDLLAAPIVVDALANCPHTNNIIPVDMSGVSRWQHGKDLNNLLKAGSYDVAFILNRSLHCAVTTAVSRIPVRIGYANELRRFFLTVPIPYVFDRNEVDCHLDMLRSIGLTAQRALPDLWVTEEEKQSARQLIADQGWNGKDRLIALQPGANDPAIREWGADRYARVADRLVSEVGGTVVIMGGSAEARTAAAMSAAMRTKSINLVGAVSIREAISTIGVCDLWVGNDTGLLHCAVAQRVPSVGIFGPNKVVRWGYDAPRHRSLVNFGDGRADDDAAVRRCLDAVTEQEVFDTALTVLSEPEHANASGGANAGCDADGQYHTRGPYYDSAPQVPAAAFVVRRR